jgi:hypothetical protein
MTAAHESIKWSQLSMTSSNLRDLSTSHSVSITGRAPSSCTPSTVATAWGTSVLSRNPPRSTNHTPSSNLDTCWAATCNANRVLPTPPGPARVSSFVWSRSATTCAASASRPTKLVSCRGRLCCAALVARFYPAGPGKPYRCAPGRPGTPVIDPAPDSPADQMEPDEKDRVVWRRGAAEGRPEGRRSKKCSVAHRALDVRAKGDGAHARVRRRAAGVGPPNSPR